MAPSASVLIVDDEPGLRSVLAAALRGAGWRVDAAESGEDCLERAARRSYDAILLDVRLPGLDGLATLEALRDRRADAQVIVMSGHGNIESAVRAIKMGAFDFLEKPFSLDRAVLVTRNALRQRHLEAENRELRAHVDRRSSLVGEGPAIQQLRQQIEVAAPTNGRVLIVGANGTGKELVARSLHARSRRSAGPFVEMNCAAIPEELIESELFGHARGAFTGAVGARAGKFRAADGGTLFLDEVGDMTLRTQAKMLRVLEEQVVEPLGGDVGTRVDVRVVAATNKDLAAEIENGTFRSDLFFRLDVIRIAVPPLAARREDIPLLAAHFLRTFAREDGHRVKTLDASALTVLHAHPWPGNVRELRNVIERLAVMVSGDVITARDLGFLVGAHAPVGAPAPGDLRPLREARERFERDYIVQALSAYDGNVSRAAEALRVERSNLHRKMRAFGITSPRRTGGAPLPVAGGLRGRDPA